MYRNRGFTGSIKHILTASLAARSAAKATIKVEFDKMERLAWRRAAPPKSSAKLSRSALRLRGARARVRLMEPVDGRRAFRRPCEGDSRGLLEVSEVRMLT